MRPVPGSAARLAVSSSFRQERTDLWPTQAQPQVKFSLLAIFNASNEYTPWLPLQIPAQTLLLPLAADRVLCWLQLIKLEFLGRGSGQLFTSAFSNL